MKPAMQFLISITTVVAMLAPSIATAHPGHTNGLVAGLAHPLMGIDHLLAMLAVGVWSAQLCGHSRYAVPVTFVLLMVAGALIGFGQSVPVAVEMGVVGSIVVLGLLIARAVRPPLTTSLLLAGSFAALHGYAHGAEIPAEVSSLAFVAGMALTTLVLQMLGVTLARSWLSQRHRLQRWSGADFS